MSERYMTLLGSEQVQSAGNRMVEAAEHMRIAAGSIDESLSMHQRFLDDWLQRFEAAMERKP